MILAATGLQRERRIVAGPDVEAIAGGGDPARLEAMLERFADRASGIISIGIAGALAPGLQVGQWVVADAVLVDGEPMPIDPAWTSRLAARLPEAARGLLLGANAMVADATQKASLHSTTGALAVDMESHIVARVARRHRLPFAAARVVSDAAHRSLPPAVRVGMKSDGGMDLSAVLRSLLAEPSQLPALIRTGFEAERGFRALLRGRRRLGRRLGGPDLA
ncbi:MAG TPA: phosphorylase [Reyranella sp.]|jgi:adenosylhomocysteine nucleosidase|nr:phosphorylase [Reyranella sp.]